MPTRKQAKQALALALDKPLAAIDALSRPLTKIGLWPPAKPGRGAPAITPKEAAAFLLACLADTPSKVTGFVENYWNALPIYQDIESAALQKVLSLGDNTPLHEYIAAILMLYSDRRQDALVHWDPSRHPQPFMIRTHMPPRPLTEAWDYFGPDVRISVSGPWPSAIISFYPSQSFNSIIESYGGFSQPTKELRFLFWHELIANDARAKANVVNQPYFGRDVVRVRERSKLGIKFEHSVAGREIEALATVLRAADAKSKKTPGLSFREAAEFDQLRKRAVDPDIEPSQFSPIESNRLRELSERHLAALLGEAPER